jgi:predicted acyl esterase
VQPEAVIDLQLSAQQGAPAINLSDGIARIQRTEPDTMRVEIGLWPVSALIPSGDRLRLEISSSNFPRFDAHPNTPGNSAHATATKLARQTVHHTADAPSRLTLRVF